MSNVKDIVKEKYGETARLVAAGRGSSFCCGADVCCDTVDPITSNLYDGAQKSGLPEKVILASLGCGNPTALAELKPGETVLDLGSGGGIDVLLSAKHVGPSTKILLVTLAETTSVLEAVGLQADLRRSGFEPWAGIINNSVAAAHPLSPLLRQRAHNELREIEAVAKHHAHRYAVVPLLREEPVVVAHLLELSGHLATADCA